MFPFPTVNTRLSTATNALCREAFGALYTSPKLVWVKYLMLLLTLRYRAPSVTVISGSPKIENGLSKPEVVQSPSKNPESRGRPLSLERLLLQGFV